MSALGGDGVLIGRHNDGKSGTVAFVALDRDGTAHTREELAGDIQPQPCAAVSAAVAGVGLCKGFKDHVPTGFRDTNTGIFDFKP